MQRGGMMKGLRNIINGGQKNMRGGIMQQMKHMMGADNGPGGGMNMMKSMRGNMNPSHMHLPHVSLRNMLKELDLLEKRGKTSMKLKTMASALKHQILDKVSCITGCMLHKNEHGMCYEQSCAFHYQPGLNEKKKPILCADELTLMALNQDAEGQVHFAVKPYSIEPEDDMTPTEFYDNMEDKYKYRKRSKDGSQIEATTKVCHKYKCAEHPPPVTINAGDTLYVTIVAFDDDGEYKHLHPGSFRVIALGSESGKSCPSGNLIPMRL